ncbi:MAG: hypothetical protein JWP44_3053 [Mucilaginibacter sp.]|nr:hypothetical protein [Mucilaginibacter sp.]
MPSKENISSTKNVTDLLFYGNNLIKVLTFSFGLISLSFSIGFYFGNQSEQSKHTVEINNLNFQHAKDLNDAIDKKREYEDQINQHKIEDLQNLVFKMQQQINDRKK